MKDRKGLDLEGKGGREELGGEGKRENSRQDSGGQDGEGASEREAPHVFQGKARVWAIGTRDSRPGNRKESDWRSFVQRYFVCGRTDGEVEAFAGIVGLDWRKDIALAGVERDRIELKPEIEN